MGEPLTAEELAEAANVTPADVAAAQAFVGRNVDRRLRGLWTAREDDATEEQ